MIALTTKVEHTDVDNETFQEILNDRTAPHEPLLLINNKKVFKATILKQKNINTVTF